MTDNDDWATGTLREAPFWRKGMSPEEYDIERMHWQRTFDGFREHVPLWKLKEQGDDSYSENYRIALELVKKYS